MLTISQTADNLISRLLPGELREHLFHVLNLQRSGLQPVLANAVFHRFRVSFAVEFLPQVPVESRPVSCRKSQNHRISVRPVNPESDLASLFNHMLDVFNIAVTCFPQRKPTPTDRYDVIGIHAAKLPKCQNNPESI